MPTPTDFYFSTNGGDVCYSRFFSAVRSRLEPKPILLMALLNVFLTLSLVFVTLLLAAPLMFLSDLGDVFRLLLDVG